MRKIYQILGASLLALFTYGELTGWDAAIGSQKNTLPAGARNAGGWRSYHFWSGGK